MHGYPKVCVPECPGVWVLCSRSVVIHTALCVLNSVDKCPLCIQCFHAEVNPAEDVSADVRFPTREVGKYLTRPEVPKAPPSRCQSSSLRDLALPDATT